MCDDFDYFVNFFWMIFGEEVDDVVVDVFNCLMILYVEYFFNVFMFIVCVIILIFSDIYLVVVGVIGVFKGLLYGGVNEVVLYIFDEIGLVDVVEVWFDKVFVEKCKIMGFGYCVYKKGDLCVLIMKVVFDIFVEYYDCFEVVDFYNMLELEFVVCKGIYFNFDYLFGFVYNLIGFDIFIFMLLFVVVCVIGWMVYVIE